MLPAFSVGAQRLGRKIMIQHTKILIRTDRVEYVRQIWQSATWIRRNVEEPTWFAHDYAFIRREARKARLY